MKTFRKPVSIFFTYVFQCHHYDIRTGKYIHKMFFKHILTHDKTPCLLTGLLHVKTSRVACSCGHRSLSPCGKCSTKATGAKTNPHLIASAALKMFVACSQTARWEPEGCLLLRYLCVKSREKTNQIQIKGEIFTWRSFCGSSSRYLI